MTPLDSSALAALARHLPGWRCEGGSLERTFTFPSFTAALDFMQACIPVIERLDHHPDWRNVYLRIDVRLTTHEAGERITTKDVELAQAMEQIAKR